MFPPQLPLILDEVPHGASIVQNAPDIRWFEARRFDPQSEYFSWHEGSTGCWNGPSWMAKSKL